MQNFTCQKCSSKYDQLRNCISRGKSSKFSLVILLLEKANKQAIQKAKTKKVI